VEFEWCPSQISVLDLLQTRGADLGRFRQQFVSVNQAIAKLTVAPHQYIQPATGVAGLGTLALQCGHGHRVQLAIGDVALAPEPYRLGHEAEAMASALSRALLGGRHAQTMWVKAEQSNLSETSAGCAMAGVMAGSRNSAAAITGFIITSPCSRNPTTQRIYDDIVRLRVLSTEVL
jgi:hypothetical protein